jgi:predicted RNA-binding protein YlxR (DUF448 family)
MAIVTLRTCIGCYRMANKKELIRIVRSSDNSIIVDLDGTKNGRGAYLCPNIDCINKAMNFEKLNRAFRTAPYSVNQLALYSIDKTMQTLIELIKQ